MAILTRRFGTLRTTLLSASLTWAAACGPPAAEEPPRVAEETPSPPREAPLFVDRAAELGLDFVNWNGRSGRLYLAEITCGGGAFLDADQDGDLDVYLAQGHMLGPPGRVPDVQASPVEPHHPLPHSDRLYRNELVETGRLAFTDVTEEAGLAAGGAAATLGYGCGAATGDADGDGRTDLLVLNLGANQLLLNRSTGGKIAFVDVTAEADVGGTLRDDRTSVAASFLDYDADGRLDLFVANNLDFDYAREPKCYDQTGADDYCGPGAYPPEPDQLFKNMGGDPPRFAEVTAEAGMGEGWGPALGAVTADFNGDGKIDVYVANDGQPNNLWRNLGDGTFFDEGLMAGASVNAQGESEASMGVDAGDVDNDGDLDLFMTHLIDETNTLYLNDGTGLFDDRTLGAGLGAESLLYTSFGTAFFDYDNDGFLDLLIVSGAVTNLPRLVAAGDPFPLHQPNQLFRNLGGEGRGVRFTEVTKQAGEAFELSEVSRGALFGDVDNDGDQDVLVGNNGGPVRLLLNQTGQDRHWLGLRVVTGDPPRDALGAMVTLLRDGQGFLWRRVRTDGSYNSAHDPRVLFGLGDDPKVDGVRIVWPDGSVETWPASAVAAGRYTTLAQGGE